MRARDASEWISEVSLYTIDELVAATEAASDSIRSGDDGWS